MMGQEHMKNLALLRSNTSFKADVVAIVDPDQQMRETAGSLALELGFNNAKVLGSLDDLDVDCLLYTSPSPRDLSTSRMPSSA